MKILVLDDDQLRHDAFKKNLKGHDVTHVYSANDAAKAVKEHAKFDAFFLDHDLADFADSGTGYGAAIELTGADFAAWLARPEEMGGAPKDKIPSIIWIHSWNPDGAKRMKGWLENLPCNIVVQPWNTETGK